MKHARVSDRVCRCGHVYRTYTPAPPDDLDRSLGFEDGLTVTSYVVERQCPHDTGTVLELCPKCDRKVGMWGMSWAGAAECPCWQNYEYYQKNPV